MTVEAFNAWRNKFEAEQALQKAQLGDSIKADTRAGRLTGKQWFMQQIAAGQEVSGSEEEEEEEEEGGADGNADEVRGQADKGAGY